MGLITKISLRNLVRQKRRNFFLGLGIMVGMSILIVTSAFTNGITDNLFNNLIVNISGHIRLSGQERNAHKLRIIRDKNLMSRYVQDNVQDVKEISEEISAFTRILGNDRAANVALVGILADENFLKQANVLSGDIHNLFNHTVNKGIVLYENTAKDINVKVNDKVRARYNSIYGQVEAALLTVVAILKSENIFIDTAGFMNMDDLKPALGYKPWETGALMIVLNKLNDPNQVVRQADRLYRALTPPVACLPATLGTQPNALPVAVFSFNDDVPSMAAVKETIPLQAGSYDDFFGQKTALLLSDELARRLQLRPGNNITLQYLVRYTKQPVNVQLQLAGIIKAGSGLDDKLAFINNDVFYQYYYSQLPEMPADTDNILRALPTAKPFQDALLKQWVLLERSHDTQSSLEKYRRLESTIWRGTVLDVQTMYETASVILQLQSSLNIVSLIAVLILFFIILIGVINTLRMSIRERTREIGTNRAIGMQRQDVKLIFIAEIFFLTLFACLAGILLAFIIINLLKLLTFNLSDNPLSILLVKNHLYFVPTLPSILFNLILILIIAVVTAYFPSRRAANMHVAEALRHYE